MRTYQNEHNMLLKFPRCRSILLLQTSKTDNNALDIDAIYNLKLKKHNLIQQTALFIKLNAKFPWPPLCQNNVNAFYFRIFLNVKFDVYQKSRDNCCQS
jgi:hypothetical protein